MVSCFLQDTFGRKKCLILCRYYMYVIPNNGLPGTSFYILWPISILISKLSSVSQVIGCLLLYLANSYAYLLAAFSFAGVRDSDQEKLYQEPRPYSMLEFPIVPVYLFDKFLFRLRSKYPKQILISMIFPRHDNRDGSITQLLPLVRDEYHQVCLFQN